MLKICNITGNKSETSLREFSMELETKGKVESILSPQQNFIDELLQVFLYKEGIKKGELLLNGRDLFDKKYNKVCFVMDFSLLFHGLRVYENIYFDEFHFIFAKKRYIEECYRLFGRFDIGISPLSKMRKVTKEENIIIQLLKSYVQNPDLVIISGIMGQLTYRYMTAARRIVNAMLKSGTEVIYLSNQLEDALKIAEEITLVVGGEIWGKYTQEDIKKNPDQIYYAMVGGHRIENNQKVDLEKVELLKEVNESILNLSSKYNFKMAMKEFAQKVVRTYGADNCVIYLSQEDYNSILRIHAMSTTEKVLPIIKSQLVHNIVNEEAIKFIREKEETDYVSYFEQETDYKSICCIGKKSSGNALGLLEICFLEDTEYEERKKVQYELLGQEFALLLENINLTGKSVLLQESHHRIKNNLQMVISLIQMEKNSSYKKLSSEAEREQLDQILNGIIRRIQSISNVQNLLLQEKVLNNIIDVKLILDSIVEMYRECADIRVITEEVLISYSKAVSLALVINELVSNSVKHNKNNEALKIDILLCRNNVEEEYIILVYDNGIGFMQENVQKLKQRGVGVRVISAIVCNELGGTLEFYNVPDKGAVCEIHIPVDSFA